MTHLPEGWDRYDPDDDERSAQPAYARERALAATQAERRRLSYGEALGRLRRAMALTQTIRRIEALAATPAASWSPADLGAFPHSTSGVPDPPPVRLVPWTNIFADELMEVHDLASGDAHTDPQVWTGLYLAARLISTVADVSLDLVDGFDLAAPPALVLEL